jgi:hypothetical protein
MIVVKDDKMKFERIDDMCALKKEIISYLFDAVSRRMRDTWWTYKGEFQYQGETYNLECDCKWDNILFTYKNLHIEHKQQVIDIDEFVKRGLIQ